MKPKHPLKSRKFWAGLVAALIPIVNALMHHPLDWNAVWIAVGSLISYILAETGVDIARHYNNNKR